MAHWTALGGSHVHATLTAEQAVALARELLTPAASWSAASGSAPVILEDTMVMTKLELLASLQNETRILLHLASKIDHAQLDYRPTPKQHSTIELLRYLTLPIT